MGDIKTVKDKIAAVLISRCDNPDALPSAESVEDFTSGVVAALGLAEITHDGKKYWAFPQ